MKSHMGFEHERE